MHAVTHFPTHNDIPMSSFPLAFPWSSHDEFEALVTRSDKQSHGISIIDQELTRVSREISLNAHDNALLSPRAESEIRHPRSLNLVEQELTKQGSSPSKTGTELSPPLSP